MNLLPLLFLMASSALCLVRADELPAVLSEGEPRVPLGRKWNLATTNDVATLITYERPAISPGPIVQCKTTALHKEMWRTHAGVSSTGTYSSGDAVLVTGRARCLETTNSSGRGLIHAHFENAVPPYTKLFTAYLRVPKEWTRFNLPLTVPQNIEAGKGKVIFNLGYEIQLIELCDVQVYRFPAGFDITRLPKSEFKQIVPKVP